MPPSEPEPRPTKRTRRRALVRRVHAVEHDDGTLLVEQLVPAEAWDAGLTAKQRARESTVARREFERLSRTLQGNANWQRWRKHGSDEFRRLLEQCLEQRGEWLTLLAYQAPMAAMRHRAAGVFQTVVDTVYSRAYPVHLEGKFVPVAARCPFVEPRAKAWRKLAMSILKACGEPRDEWHQAAVLGLVLCPELAAMAVQYGFWLAPPEQGQTDLERQAAAMVGAPETTERAAAKAKRDARNALGYVPPRVRPGPKPGSRRRLRPSRVAFIEYVATQRAKGVSPTLIAQDAQAASLYQASRREMQAELNEQIVRRALLSHDASSS